MKKGTAAVATSIIFIIIIAVLITGCQALSEPRASNEKPLKKKALDFSENIGLKKEIARLGREKQRLAADFNAQLKNLEDKLSQKEKQFLELNNSKNTLTGQLQEVTAKLSALISANNYLEKQIKELNRSEVSLEKE